VVHRFLSWLWLVAMSLVTVYGLAAVKEVLAGYDMASQMIGEQPEPGLRRWLLATVPLFVWWSLAILALGFLPGEGRRIWRRPGIVPGMAVLLFTARNVIESAVLQLRWRGPAPLESWWLLRLATPTPASLVTISHSAGMAVASTWLALWIGDWWHPAPTWNDRAGRALGWYWIAVCLVDPFYFSIL
jgi:hypothetical protein